MPQDREKLKAARCRLSECFSEIEEILESIGCELDKTTDTLRSRDLRSIRTSLLNADDLIVRELDRAAKLSAHL